jgi:hypothetical protein
LSLPLALAEFSRYLKKAMEQDQQIEWQLFRDQACEHLRRVDHARKPRYKPLLQFLRLPSFGDVKCVDVLQKDDEILAFQTTWFVSRDFDRIATRLERLKHGRFLAPTLASIQLAESSTELEFLIDGVRSLFIPLTNVESSVSIDGVGYELMIGYWLHGIRVYWHNTLPEGWGMIAPAVDVLYEMVSRTIE